MTHDSIPLDDRIPLSPVMLKPVSIPTPAPMSIPLPVPAAKTEPKPEAKAEQAVKAEAAPKPEPKPKKSSGSTKKLATRLATATGLRANRRQIAIAAGALVSLTCGLYTVKLLWPTHPAAPATPSAVAPQPATLPPLVSAPLPTHTPAQEPAHSVPTPPPIHVTLPAAGHEHAVVTIPLTPVTPETPAAAPSATVSLPLPDDLTAPIALHTTKPDEDKVPRKPAQIALSREPEMTITKPADVAHAAGLESPVPSPALLPIAGTADPLPVPAAPTPPVTTPPAVTPAAITPVAPTLPLGTPPVAPSTLPVPPVSLEPITPGVLPTPAIATPSITPPSIKPEASLEVPAITPVAPVVATPPSPSFTPPPPVTTPMTPPVSLPTAKPEATFDPRTPVEGRPVEPITPTFTPSAPSVTPSAPPAPAVTPVLETTPVPPPAAIQPPPAAVQPPPSITPVFPEPSTPVVKPVREPVPHAAPLDTPSTLQFRKPAGSDDVRPVSATAGERPARTDFDVGLHEPRAGETYETISEEWYNTKKLAAALRAYNRNKTLQGQGPVEVPPIDVLRRAFPQFTSGDGRMSSTVPSAGAEWSAPGVGTSETYRTVGAKEFVVPAGGMTMRDAARTALGRDTRWGELYELNPEITNPGAVLPAGTRLRLP